ncbi:hypothetical protein NPIL_604181 [Nephila pilipes]|uniref:Uncharacterized protein n=1 Tax=Nephila pilipes TaxID=299642 RepID=A0A8X6R1A9_NEPPI|nr:hypothetical protein NPIL_604181 [Nephila pilipes]
MKNPNDLVTVKICFLVTVNDDDEGIVLDQSDTDEDEHILEREDDSEEIRDTDGAGVEVLLGFIYLADVYHGNRVNLEEL